MFFKLTLRDIQEIMKTVDECKTIIEVEIYVGEKKVIIKKSSTSPGNSELKSPLYPLIKKEDVKEKKDIVVQTEFKEDEDLIPIKSPMVGTFYRAPSSGAKPYVEVGQVIAAGQVLCIIEAMKLMNEIESEVPGRVVKILVENEKPVEFGQTLFLVEPL